MVTDTLRLVVEKKYYWLADVGADLVWEKKYCWLVAGERVIIRAKGKFVSKWGQPKRTETKTSPY